MSERSATNTPNNFYRKEISAKVFDTEENTKQNGEKYGKFWLMQGKSKIVALAFGETFELAQSVLKVKVNIHF